MVRKRVNYICSIDGCLKKAQSKTYCTKHYYRFWKYGCPLTTMRTPTGDPMRFLKKTISDNSNECVLWPFTKDKDGYGSIRIGDRGKVRVNRYVLEITSGLPTDDSLIACHKPLICHNPSCINPNHLYWGSYQQNADDKKLDKTVLMGENHPVSKLNNSDILKIRSDNRLHRIIADEYDITDTSVSFIKSKKIWKHL